MHITRLTAHFMCSLMSDLVNSKFVCLCILHQSCLTITAGTANCPILGGIWFQSTPPLEGAGVFNVPEGDSPQNTEPPFRA